MAGSRLTLFCASCNRFHYIAYIEHELLATILYQFLRNSFFFSFFLFDCSLIYDQYHLFGFRPTIRNNQQKTFTLFLPLFILLFIIIITIIILILIILIL